MSRLLLQSNTIYCRETPEKLSHWVWPQDGRNGGVRTSVTRNWGGGGCGAAKYRETSRDRKVAKVHVWKELRRTLAPSSGNLTRIPLPLFTNYCFHSSCGRDCGILCPRALLAQCKWALRQSISFFFPPRSLHLLPRQLLCFWNFWFFL